jgi:hypothetical protein
MRTRKTIMPLAFAENVTLLAGTEKPQGAKKRLKKEETKLIGTLHLERITRMKRAV